MMRKANASAAIGFGVLQGSLVTFLLVPATAASLPAELLIGIGAVEFVVAWIFMGRGAVLYARAKSPKERERQGAMGEPQQKPGTCPRCGGPTVPVGFAV